MEYRRKKISEEKWKSKRYDKIQKQRQLQIIQIVHPT